eukprot:366548-Chlamydomonas_euryale.AAC.5
MQACEHQHASPPRCLECTEMDGRVLSGPPHVLTRPSLALPEPNALRAARGRHKTALILQCRLFNALPAA